MVLGQGTHFGSEHFVTIDEVSEESCVGVGEVEGGVHDEVGEISQDSVERVVLQLG